MQAARVVEDTEIDGEAAVFAEWSANKTSSPQVFV